MHASYTIYAGAFTGAAEVALTGRGPRATVIRKLFLALSLLVGPLPAFSQTEKADGDIKRPEYGIESKVKRPLYQTGSAGRFNEDWSVLKGVDLSKTDDFWDRLK